MTDIKGIEMKTGDIVEIKGAYFKNDNGIYFVANTPGDASWCGSDYSLTKMCKNGKISTSSKNIAFWPLCSFTNNRQKNADCKAWNKEHATIEVIYNIDNSQVIEHFKAEAEMLKKQAERDAMYYGENEKCTILSRNIYNLYIEVAARMEAEKAETVEDQPEETNQDQPQDAPEVEISDKTPEAEEQTAEAEKAEEQPVKAVRKYFDINEKMASDSKKMWSFDDYQKDSETAAYKKEVDRVYNLVDEITEKKPGRSAEAEAIAARFSKAYAGWINKKFSIDLQCPSVMICGAGNFPTRRKEKQVAALDKHYKDLSFVNALPDKLKNILNGKDIIKSGDADAIEKLQDKLEQLEAKQECMKALNAYYRKNGTCKGFRTLTDETASEYDKSVAESWDKKPVQGFYLTNNNAKIKATKARIEELTKAKEAGTKETIKTDVCQVIENSEIMRLQLVFDGKPDDETRNILKKNGFRWAPSSGSWQRQLTDNARYSTKKVIEQLEKIRTA